MKELGRILAQIWRVDKAALLWVILPALFLMVAASALLTLAITSWGD